MNIILIIAGIVLVGLLVKWVLEKIGEFLSNGFKSIGQTLLFLTILTIVAMLIFPREAKSIVSGIITPKPRLEKPDEYLKIKH